MFFLSSPFAPSRALCKLQRILLLCCPPEMLPRIPASLLYICDHSTYCITPFSTSPSNFLCPFTLFFLPYCSRSFTSLIFNLAIPSTFSPFHFLTSASSLSLFISILICLQILSILQWKTVNKPANRSHPPLVLQILQIINFLASFPINLSAPGPPENCPMPHGFKQLLSQRQPMISNHQMQCTISQVTLCDLSDVSTLTNSSSTHPTAQLSGDRPYGLAAPSSLPSGTPSPLNLSEVIFPPSAFSRPLFSSLFFDSINSRILNYCFCG